MKSFELIKRRNRSKDDSPDLVRIEPKDGGPAVYREQLHATIGGRAINGIYLYSPDKAETEPATDTVTLKMGGLWTIGHHYTHEAIAMAQNGYPFATFVPNFNYPAYLPLVDRRHRDSPYLLHAQNAHYVSEAVMQHTGTNRIRVSGHSYAGMTATEYVSEFPNVIESVVLQDPAGLDGHSIRLGSLWNDELRAGLGLVSDQDILPPDVKKHSIQRVAGNFPHALREIAGLIRLRADMQANLRKAREKGVPVGLLLLGKSAIFDAQSVLKIAETGRLFDVIDTVDDYHIAPNIRPEQEVVPAQITMFEQLKDMRAAA